MERIRYAAGHQAVSALISVVCIPLRYCDAVRGFVQGTEFVLYAPTSIAGYPDETTWRVAGSLHCAKPPLNPGLLSFLRTVWPFISDRWIRADDEVYWFAAELLDEVPREVLSHVIEAERKRIHEEKGGDSSCG